VFFVGRDELHGGELWRSDGTREGTVLLADINAGPEGSLISQYIALKDDVLFFADDGIYGYELWGSNGSPQGTRLVADILPGPTSSAEQFSVSMVPGEVDGIALFAATDGEHGLELWRSDGTAHGTWLVQDIATGPGSSSPTRIVPAGEQIFFLANDNRHGWELWAMPRRAVDGPAPQPLRPVSGEGCQTSTTSGGASMVVVLGSIVLWTLAARAPARRASRPRCRPNG
jgi:ELWxxDGT repeat protein